LVEERKLRMENGKGRETPIWKGKPGVKGKDAKASVHQGKRRRRGEKQQKKLPGNGETARHTTPAGKTKNSGGKFSKGGKRQNGKPHTRGSTRPKKRWTVGGLIRWVGKW